MYYGIPTYDVIKGFISSFVDNKIFIYIKNVSLIDIDFNI